MPDCVKQAYPADSTKTDYSIMAATCRALLEKHPEERDYLLAYEGVYLGYSGKYNEAVIHCREYLPTIKIKECIDDMQVTLERNLKLSGDIEGAIEVLKQTVENEEYKSHTYDTIREYYTELKDTDNIIKYCLLMIEEGPCDTEIYTQLANAYDEKKDYLNSAKYFEQAALSMNDETSWLWNNAGRALALAGNQEEAMFYFRMVLKLKPDSDMAHYYLGLSYQQQQDYYRAMHHYTEALKIRPDFPEVYNNIAALSYYENSNINEAIKNLEKALESNPDEKFITTLYLNLARLYKTIADYDRYEYYRKKVLESVGFSVESDDDLSEEDEDDSDVK